MSNTWHTAKASIHRHKTHTQQSEHNTGCCSELTLGKKGEKGGEGGGARGGERLGSRSAQNNPLLGKCNRDDQGRTLRLNGSLLMTQTHTRSRQFSRLLHPSLPSYSQSALCSWWKCLCVFVCEGQGCTWCGLGQTASQSHRPSTKSNPC